MDVFFDIGGLLSLPLYTKIRYNGNRPDFVVKKRIGSGDRVTWERIGVAWQNENGAIFLRFHGTQVLSGGEESTRAAADSMEA